MRGLMITLALGLVVLAGLSKALGLLELEKLIESFTPSLAVILVILFQPELRRIISQLGEQNRLGKLLKKGQAETIGEVVQGVSAMAGQRIGALIAFEREFALDDYTHNAVKLDSVVNRLTLESIFHPGGSLHDGAVVIRGDRIVAAACLFPLTENADLPKSMGTRHRAALGLSDETDAVTVIVSEETGQVAVCRRGKIENGLSPQRLEKVLRDRLGLADSEGDPEDQRKSLLQRFLQGALWTFTADVPRKLSAIALGALLVFIAHQEITQVRDYNVQVRASTGSSSEPEDGLFLIRLPSDEYHLVTPEENKWLRVSVTGSAAEIDRLGGNLSGVLDVTADMVGKPTDLRIEMLQGNWGNVLGIEVDWASGIAPRLAVEQRDRQLFPLGPEHLTINTSRLNPNFQVLMEEVEFTPDILAVKGPIDADPPLGSEGLPLLLEAITLDEDARSTQEYRLRLHSSLADAGFGIEDDATVEVTVPIVPFQLEIGTIEQEISVSALSGTGEAASRWRLPARSETARFRIVTRGVLPTEIERGSPAWLEKTSSIRNFVEENLRVFVDVSALSEATGSEAEVEWMWRREWGVASNGDPERASEPGSIEVQLESEERILLEESGTSESNPKGPNGREGNG